jgi:PPP family 3-phenylpropionic acid transporter
MSAKQPHAQTRDEHVMRLTLFVYFLGFGVFLPYFSPFLLAQGFSPQEVGFLLAAVMASKIIGPPLLGWWVDHHNRILPALRLMTLVSISLFAMIFVLKFTQAAFGFWLLVLGLFGLAWQPLLSQLDVLTLRLVAGRAQVYSALRAWGSIGFIVSSVGLGFIVNGLTPAAQAGWIAGLLMVALLGLWLLLQLLHEPAPPSWPERAPCYSTEFGDSFWQKLQHPALIGFLLMQFLVNVSHGVYYAFFSVYLAEQGYSSGAIGLLWALGVVAEIILFFVMPKFLLHISQARLLAVALALMAVRWVLIGTQIDALFWILIAQLLHAASFGVTHAVGIAVIHQQFTGRMQSRGQAIFSGFSYGGGAAVGLMLAGWLWTHLGAMSSFLMMSLLSLAAGLMLFTCHRLVSLAPVTPTDDRIEQGV